MCSHDEVNSREKQQQESYSAIVAEIALDEPVDARRHAR